MSLYPSLEDMQLDKLLQAQTKMMNELSQSITSSPSSTSSYPTINENMTSSPTSNSNLNLQLYPDINNFLGMELSESMIRENMPQFGQQQLTQNLNIQNSSSITTNKNMIAPLSGSAVISSRAEVTHGIREIILCKDANGKVGMRVQAVNNGIFVAIVVKNSPAALAGLRFGDQILQLNGQLLAGYTVDKVHKMLKKSSENNISVIVRDRPFERTITLIKDSNGGVGFQFENGKIVSIVKDSSAARNGLLTDHNLLEVNGQTVVAMKDKEVKKIINDADKIIKITIIPSFIYDHMVKKISTSFLRGIMDHSIPEF